MAALQQVHALYERSKQHGALLTPLQEELTRLARPHITVEARRHLATPPGTPTLFSKRINRREEFDTYLPLTEGGTTPWARVLDAFIRNPKVVGGQHTAVLIEATSRALAQDLLASWIFSLYAIVQQTGGIEALRVIFLDQAMMPRGDVGRHVFNKRRTDGATLFGEDEAEVLLRSLRATRGTKDKVVPRDVIVFFEAFGVYVL